ncbi:MAG: 23S rRNA (guanosine(2251)-2'-O)-methyltransferase RlmB [Bacilli bacterium]|jgi:23S rRNA (guanosine2251-2'-O)-methyltransferase|nr:23S rRNA (guanosine(2251)-2'-O)-methyltransferase RlmB [Bacilli bacterium]
MYVYGKNVVTEILKKKEKIDKIYISEHFRDNFIESSIQNLKINTEILPKKELDKLANGNHQGIIVSVPDYQYCELQELLGKENPFLILLDHLEDPHNLGAIIRTSEAAGVDGIIIPKNRSVSVNATVLKTSAGAAKNMKIAMVTNLKQTIEYLKRQGFWIVGTDMEGTDFEKLDYHGKIAIVIGNEGSGMSRLVKESCDFIASIPMYGEINSLNASVAAGIMIYEAVKQRK